MPKFEFGGEIVWRPTPELMAGSHLQRFMSAHGLRALGLGHGDAIGVFMPMTPETVVAMLAIIKIGAVFLPLFSGFGPQAIVSRLKDADAKALFTADGCLRRGRISPMKTVADAA